MRLKSVLYSMMFLLFLFLLVLFVGFLLEIRDNTKFKVIQGTVEVGK